MQKTEENSAAQMQSMPRIALLRFQAQRDEKNHRPVRPPLSNKKMVAITLATMLLSSTASSAREIDIEGIGIRKCFEWNSWKSEKNGEARAMATQWAQGFIAGHNVYTNAAKETSGLVPSKAAVIIPLMDNYCEGAPQIPIVAALINITKNLGGSKMTVLPHAQSEDKPRLPAITPEKGREL
jgi:hypothetical protein